MFFLSDETVTLTWWRGLSVSVTLGPTLMFMINSHVENSLPEWSMERVQTKSSLFLA